ncbi:MAG: PIN domain-containing protein [Proteobacteria bacterium]|nr:PIN domain-containing protein [Pseudomonadota bacterium]
MKDFNIQPDAVYFVDTNIWLYSFIQSSHKEKYERAKKIIKECEIFISTQIINEMCVNLIKKAEFSEDKIQNLIDALYRKSTVFELSQDILIMASKIRSKHSFSFWDSVVASSALDCEADFLLSEDMQGGFILEEKLTIINPFE